MKRYSTTELRRLEIVNVCNGERLGYASDFEFETNCDSARVTALIIAGSHGIFGFGSEDDLVIPWARVQCIGEDTILVQLNPETSSGCVLPRKKNGKHRL